MFLELRRILAITLGALTLVTAVAIESSYAEDAVRIGADQFEHQENTGLYIARGNVELVYGKRVLKADNVTFDAAREMATAEGNVVLLLENGEVIFSESTRLNQELDQGDMSQLRMILTDQSRLAARQAKLSPNQTQVDYAVYSPCSACEEEEKTMESTPLWQIKARKIIHDRSAKSMIYRHAVFEIYGVPIAYTPYFSHASPDVVRRNGLLFPTLRNSSLLGQMVGIPYFQTIGDHSDVTINPIFTTKQGPILHLKGRNRSKSGQFDFDGSITKGDRYAYSGSPNPQKDKLRGHIFTQSNFIINRNMRWGFNIERSSDDTYLRRYGFGDARSLISRLFVEGFQKRSYLSAETLGFQDQRANVRQEDVPVIFPNISYDFVSDPTHYGGYWTWNSNINHLNRSKGSKRVRFVNRVGFSLPYTSPSGHSFQLDSGVRADYYNVGNAPRTLTENPPLWTEPPPVASLDEAKRSHNASRYFANAALTWKYPLLRAGKTTSQVLEPIIMLVGAPNVGVEDKITNEDSSDYEWDEVNLFTPNRKNGWDRLDGGNRIDYGLRYDIYQYQDDQYKGKNREGDDQQSGYASFLIGQSWRFRALNELSTAPGNTKQLSDIVGRIAIEESIPSGDFSLYYRFRMNPDNQSLNINEVSSRARLRSFHLWANYINIKANATTRGATRRHEINFGSYYDFLDSWSLRGAATYEIEGRGNFLDLSSSLVYLGDCVGFSFGYSRNYNRDRDYEPSANYIFRIIFKNLGTSWNKKALL